jgi:hypothetical protein
MRPPRLKRICRSQAMWARAMPYVGSSLQKVLFFGKDKDLISLHRSVHNINEL